MYTNLKLTPVFTILSFNVKTWKKWNVELKKMETSNEYKEGFKPMYCFTVDVNENEDKLMDLSRDQLMQCLLGAFESRKPLVGLTFQAKDNGKEGLEKRWWLNLTKKPEKKQELKPELDTLTSETDVNEIPF